MADENLRFTGVVEAVIVDQLFALGVENPLALTPDQRLASIRDAVRDGRIPAKRAEVLRRLGVLSDE
jgi:hypothetical protein